MKQWNHNIWIIVLHCLLYPQDSPKTMKQWNHNIWIIVLYRLPYSKDFPNTKKQWNYNAHGSRGGKQVKCQIAEAKSRIRIIFGKGLRNVLMVQGFLFPCLFSYMYLFRVSKLLYVSVNLTNILWRYLSKSRNYKEITYGNSFAFL